MIFTFPPCFGSSWIEHLQGGQAVRFTAHPLQAKACRGLGHAHTFANRKAPETGLGQHLLLAKKRVKSGPRVGGCLFGELLDQPRRKQLASICRILVSNAREYGFETLVRGGHIEKGAMGAGVQRCFASRTSGFQGNHGAIKQVFPAHPATKNRKGWGPKTATARGETSLPLPPGVLPLPLLPITVLVTLVAVFTVRHMLFIAPSRAPSQPRRSCAILTPEERYVGDRTS